MDVLPPVKGSQHAFVLAQMCHQPQFHLRVVGTQKHIICIGGRKSLTNLPPLLIANGNVLQVGIAAADYVFLSADYSQVELRLMAHLSEDEGMLAAFNRGEDIHAATAARIFKLPLEEVTSDMRRKAKTANFGIIYGISAFGLSERLNIP